jgi:hypothetical protein
MLDKYPQRDEETDFQENSNNFFFSIFLAEMIIKLIGYGILNYLRDPYNIFDSLVILFSIIEVIFQI